MKDIRSFLERFIDSSSLEDLEFLESFVKTGTFEKLIKERRQHIIGGKTCPVCHGEVVHGFELTFGPPGLRRRAYFDGLDCLEFFLNELKMRRKNATNRVKKNF